MNETPFQELLNLSGKTAIVTGGAVGIGWGISRRLAEAGRLLGITVLDPLILAGSGFVSLRQRGILSSP